MTTEKKYLVTTGDGKTLKGMEFHLNDSPSSGNTLTGINADNLQQQATDGSDAGKVLIVKSDTTGEEAGKWEIANYSQYKTVHTLTGLTGNIYTLYYLDTSTTTDTIGLYIWEEDHDSGKFTRAVAQYKKVPTFTGEVGNPSTLYYLTSVDGTRQKGLYIYDTSLSTPDFVPCSINGSIDVDGITVSKNSSNQLEVPDGVDGTGGASDIGLTVAKFVPSKVRTSADAYPIRSIGDAADDCFVTEKAIRSVIWEAVPLTITEESPTIVTAAVGWDEIGIFVRKNVD